MYYITESKWKNIKEKEELPDGKKRCMAYDVDRNAPAFFIYEGKDFEIVPDPVVRPIHILLEKIFFGRNSV